MKLDKYGDKLTTEKEELPKMPKIAFLLLTVVQCLMVTVNILVLTLDFLNFYAAFAIVPMYVFAYIHFANGYNTNVDEFVIPKYVGIVKKLSPPVYVATAVPAVFQLF